MGDFSVMFGANGEDCLAMPSGDLKQTINKLWPWGTAPVQLLNVIGSNHLSEADLIRFGLCSHRGSRRCRSSSMSVLTRTYCAMPSACPVLLGVLQSFVSDVLSTPHVQHVIKDSIHKSSNKVATDLLPYLKNLNSGGLSMPGSKFKDDRTAKFKRQRTDFPVLDRSSIEAAATALHTWINKEPSDLKLFMISGSNRLSHNAQVYQKCLRALVDQRQLDKEVFVAIMVMRFDGVKAPALSCAGDLSGFKGYL